MDEILKRSLEKQIRIYRGKNPRGGKFLVRCSDFSEASLIEAARSIPEVLDAKPSPTPGNGIVILEISPVPDIEFSYDEGKNWMKLPL